MNDEGRRWSGAESLLAGQPTQDALRDVAERRTRVTNRRVRRLVAAVVVGAAAAVVQLLREHGSGSGQHAATGARVGGGLLVAIGAVLLVAGTVKLRRSTLWRERWTAPGAVLGKPQLLQLRRQLNGRAPVDPDRLPLLRDMARRTLDLGWMIVSTTGSALLVAGFAVLSADLLMWICAVAVAVLAAWSAVGLGIGIRRARGFLADHPPVSA